MRKILILGALCGLAVNCSAYAYQAEQVTGGGTLAGVVKYDGVPPKRELVQITKDIDVCGAVPAYDPSLIVSSGGGIENAVVTITDIAKGKPFKPQADVMFDQKGCEYIPHVAVFPAGSTVSVINSDGILHNIHTEASINPIIDVAQPSFKKRIPVTVEKPEIIKVGCDAHNWMEGWWYVTANPYFAKTDAAGHFTIGDIPPGTYTVKVWQERLGVETRKVIIKPNSSVTADFLLKPAEAAKP